MDTRQVVSTLPQELTIEVLLRAVQGLGEERSKIFAAIKQGLEALISRKIVSNQVAQKLKELWRRLEAEQKGTPVMDENTEKKPVTSVDQLRKLAQEMLYRPVFPYEQMSYNLEDDSEYVAVIIGVMEAQPELRHVEVLCWYGRQVAAFISEHGNQTPLWLMEMVKSGEWICCPSNHPSTCPNEFGVHVGLQLIPIHDEITVKVETYHGDRGVSMKDDDVDGVYVQGRFISNKRMGHRPEYERNLIEVILQAMESHPEFRRPEFLRGYGRQVIYLMSDCGWEKQPSWLLELADKIPD